MKKLIVVLSVLMLLAITATPTLAAPPCNDSNGDGSPSGMEYAHYHIVSTAHNGDLGRVDHDGDGLAHAPGAHHGFSICNPSGQ